MFPVGFSLGLFGFDVWAVLCGLVWGLFSGFEAQREDRFSLGASTFYSRNSAGIA